MTPDHQTPVSVRLAARSPREIDSQLASSVQQCGVALVRSSETKGGYHREDGSHVPMTWHARYSATATDQASIDAARRRLDHAMTPPQHNQVLGWLAELSVITARRMDDEMTEDLRAAAYSRRLADYPADIARHALLVHRWKFFPTWAELANVCDDLMDARKRIDVALRMAEQKLKDEELRKSALPSEATKVMTPEERRESAARIGELMANLNAAAKADEEKRAAINTAADVAAHDLRQRARGPVGQPEAEHEEG